MLAELSVLLETVATEEVVHVLIHPATEGERMRAHETEGHSCWCDPEVLEICPECEDARETEGGEPACWRCEGKGLIPCPDPELYDGPHRLMIVHRDLPASLPPAA